MVAGPTCRTNIYLSRSGGNSLLSPKRPLCLKEFIMEFTNSPCVCLRACVCACLRACVCVCTHACMRYMSRLLGLWETAMPSAKLQISCDSLQSLADGPFLLVSLWSPSSPRFSMTFLATVSITAWLSKNPELQTPSLAVAGLLS